MVPGQRRAGEVVEAPGARLAPIALPVRLRVVAPVADHRIAAAAGAAHTLAPAVLASAKHLASSSSAERLTRSMEAMMAGGVVQQRREIDQIDGSHDGGGSSHEPVSYSRSRLHARPHSAPRPGSDPTTLKVDKSLQRNQLIGRMGRLPRG